MKSLRAKCLWAVVLVAGCTGTPSPRYRGAGLGDTTRPDADSEATTTADGAEGTDADILSDKQSEQTCLQLTGAWQLLGIGSDSCIPEEGLDLTLAQTGCAFDKKHGDSEISEMSGTAAIGSIEFFLKIWRPPQEKEGRPFEEYLCESNTYLPDRRAPQFEGTCNGPNPCRWQLRKSTLR